MSNVFRTEDGYTFYLGPDGRWWDSRDPHKVDMRFNSNSEGLPVDEDGDVVSGAIVSAPEGEL